MEKSSSIVFIFDCSKPVLIFWKDFKHAIKYRIVCRFLAPSVFLFILPFFYALRFFLFYPTSAHFQSHTCIHTQWLSVINCTEQRRSYKVLCETSCFYLCSKAESTCNNAQQTTLSASQWYRMQKLYSSVIVFTVLDVLN